MGRGVEDREVDGVAEWKVEECGIEEWTVELQ